LCEIDEWVRTLVARMMDITKQNNGGR